jgi:hypothetical protein
MPWSFILADLPISCTIALLSVYVVQLPLQVSYALLLLCTPLMSLDSPPLFLSLLFSLLSPRFAFEDNSSLLTVATLLDVQSSDDEDQLLHLKLDSLEEGTRVPLNPLAHHQLKD